MHKRGTDEPKESEKQRTTNRIQFIETVDKRKQLAISFALLCLYNCAQLRDSYIISISCVVKCLHIFTACLVHCDSIKTAIL